MAEQKKYRVIFNSKEEYDELKKVYPNIVSFNASFNLSTHYTITWGVGYRKLSMWGTGSIDYPEIKPITFKEWKEDYYKSIEILYEIY